MRDQIAKVFWEMATGDMDGPAIDGSMVIRDTLGGILSQDDLEETAGELEIRLGVRLEAAEVEEVNTFGDLCGLVERVHAEAAE